MAYPNEYDNGTDIHSPKYVEKRKPINIYHCKDGCNEYTNDNGDTVNIRQIDENEYIITVIEWLCDTCKKNKKIYE